MNYLVEMKKIAKLLDDAPCTAFIAGGAVRDIDNGFVPKDIDIFCLFDGTEAERQAMLDWMTEHGFLFRRELGEGNQYEQNFNGIEGVFDHYWRGLVVLPNGVEYWGNYPVQLILLKRNQDEVDPVKQVLNRFDLGICQTAMYYMEDREKFFVSKTELYRQNKNQNTITLTDFGKDLHLENANRVRERASRIGRMLNMLVSLCFQYQIDQWRREAEANYQQAMLQAQAAAAQDAWWNIGPGQVQYVQRGVIHRENPALQIELPQWRVVNNQYQMRNGVR